jgi:hypothetical protein
MRNALYCQILKLSKPNYSSENFLVATMADAQRKGYGDAVVRHALNTAYEVTDIKRSVLHATEAGYSVYMRLGYHTTSKFMGYMLATAKARAATVGGACVATIASNKVWFQSKMALDRLELMFATASLKQAHKVVVASMARQASRMREQTCRFDRKRSVGIFIARSGKFMMVPLVAGTWKKG